MKSWYDTLQVLKATRARWKNENKLKHEKNEKLKDNSNTQDAMSDPGFLHAR